MSYLFSDVSDVSDSGLAPQKSHSSRGSSPDSVVQPSYTPANTPPPQQFHMVYPPLAHNFNVFNYYWPGPTGLYFTAVARALPNYPDCMIRTAAESMQEYRVKASGYRELVDACIYKLEAPMRKQFKKEGNSKVECERMIGKFYSYFSFLCCDTNLSWLDFHLRTVYFHYMLRDNAVPEVLFPWLPKYESSYPDLKLDDFETAEIDTESSRKWWLERRIPGYSLTWSSLTRHLWFELYERKPQLFMRPWLPRARVEYWVVRHAMYMRILRAP
jgi:hypothetical protein